VYFLEVSAVGIRIRELEIFGNFSKAKDVIVKNFGGIELCSFGIDVPEIKLEIRQVLPNFYKASDATKEKDPLFVIVPDRKIGTVWPDDIKKYDDIRFGIATKGWKMPITHGVVFHKGTTGIYICMKHIPPGIMLEVGYLGI